MFDQIPSEILSVIVSPYLQAGCAKHPRMRIIRAYNTSGTFRSENRDLGNLRRGT